jgi:hypothetical protein
MGRPPIGKHAMTDAERQRRHRLAAIRARIAAMSKSRQAQRTSLPVSKTVNAEALVEKLTPIVEGIEAEGRKTMPTISPETVDALGAKLRRLLQELTG